MSRPAALALWSLCAAVSCVEPDYRCEQDAQCSVASDGRCEASHACSYPDATCASGRRYGKAAGSLASECTEDPVVAGTSDGSGSGGSDDAMPRCGDGIVQDPEVCDDPDGMLGEGCDRSCAYAGTVDFVRTYDGDGQRSAFRSVAASPVGGVVAVGWAQPDASDRDALVVKYDAQGVVQWAANHDWAGGGDEAHGVAVSGDGQIHAVGQQQDDRGTWSAFRAAWQSDGDPGYALALSDKEAAAIDQTAQTHLVIVGGNFAAGEAWAAQFPPFSGPQQWHVDVPSETGRSKLSDVSAWSDAECFVTGSVDGVLWLARAEPEGLTVLAALPPSNPVPQDAGQGIARSASPSQLLVGGYVTLDAQQGRAAWLGAFDLDGALRWQVRMTAPSGLAEFETVVVDDAGQIFVGGYVGGEGKQAFVRAYSPQGNFSWHRWLVDLPDAVVRDLVLDPQGVLWAVGETERASGASDGFIARIQP